MSFLLGDAISDLNLELNLVGQRMQDADYILFMDRVVKYFYTNYKMPTTQRVMDVTAYPSVTEYPLPSDFIGIMEPEKFGTDLQSPNFTHETQREFKHWPYGKVTGIKWDRETPFLILNDDTNSKFSITPLSSLTDGGTWVISGDGSNLAEDEQVYTSGMGSLSFTVAASSGAVTLTCSNLSSVDITDFLTTGRFFLDIYSPTTNTAAATSVTLKLGSSASAYYQMSATARHRGDSILNSWGTVSFDPTSKTTVGSPDSTSIDYIQISIATGLTGINGLYRVCNLFAGTGNYFQVPYYSKYNVKDNAGVYKERITATDDTILCPSDFNEAFTYKCGEIASSIRLKDQAMATYFSRELAPKLAYFASKYPRQESRLQTTWYKKVNTF